MKDKRFEKQDRKEKPIRYNNKTMFSIVREIIVHEGKDSKGYYIQKSQIEETPNPNELFEIGSINHPKNEDIVEMKWEIPRDVKDNPFGLFQPR